LHHQTAENGVADGIVGIAGVVVILLAIGAARMLVRRDCVSVQWLLIAAGLVLLNDALLTNLYGLLPDLLPGAERNWQGKLLALAGTLAVASLPAFGIRESGLTLEQAPGSFVPAAVVSAAYAAVFLALALLFPNDESSTENIAFQLTMPGFEEEPFYRGVLLLALTRAFTDRRRALGIDWSWGAIVSCVLFGLAHGFGFSDGRYHFDPMVVLLTGGPSLLAVWLALRTRSLLLPILVHNFGNAIMLVV
jgi:membrane protease YdiL (CAAX protease family)